MKLATLRDGSRDGRLVVVSRDLARAVDAASVAPTMQFAIEHWTWAEPGLRVSPAGRLLLRHLAMAFDAYLPGVQASGQRFSKAI